MCSRLGGSAVMIGMLGNDDNGKAYVDNFKVITL
jgi:sugar/nucleoside kinase (ribokinase family)